MTARPPFSAFPSFRPMFEPPGDEGPAPYLAFLRPRPDAPFFAEAARICLACVGQSGPALDSELAGLLDAGWRPQLVAAAAMLQAGPSAERASLLWRALDAERPSWVSPQLAAVARLLDPNFVGEGKVRLTGAGAPARPADPKLVGALIGLLRSLEVDWLPAVLADPETAMLIQQDAEADRGRDIAPAWAETMQGLMER